MDAIDLFKTYGIPLALLLALAVHHVRVVLAKDKEIARVNEERVRDAQESAKEMLKVATEFTDLTSDARTTMALVAKHLSS